MELSRRGIKRKGIDMAEIDGVTLRMAIDAVDAMINGLAKQLEADDSPEVGELELRLAFTCQRAAQKFRRLNV